MCISYGGFRFHVKFEFEDFIIRANYYVGRAYFVILTILLKRLADLHRKYAISKFRKFCIRFKVGFQTSIASLKFNFQVCPHSSLISRKNPQQIGRKYFSQREQQVAFGIHVTCFSNHKIKLTGYENKFREILQGCHIDKRLDVEKNSKDIFGRVEIIVVRNGY